jgi:post-segregation antitoxin (ccd killing protein)
MRFVPQIYYLKMDESDGFYFTSSLTLARRDFPITVSALINKTIQTDISASKNFVWNASLIYTFNNKYIKEQ